MGDGCTGSVRGRGRGGAEVRHEPDDASIELLHLLAPSFLVPVVCHTW